jgi:hypothetical protein
MCDHFIGFHTYQHFQTPRALWRCGSCGRQSSAPIDCCAQPDFASVQRPGMVRLSLRWWGDTRCRMMTRLRAIRLRRRHPAIEVIMLPDDKHRVHEDTDSVTLEPVANPQWTDVQTDTETISEDTRVSV